MALHMDIGRYTPLGEYLYGTKRCRVGIRYRMTEPFTQQNLISLDTTRSAGLVHHQLLEAVALLLMKQMMTEVTNQAQM